MWAGLSPDPVSHVVKHLCLGVTFYRGGCLRRLIKDRVALIQFNVAHYFPTERRVQSAQSTGR